MSKAVKAVGKAVTSVVKGVVNVVKSVVKAAVSVVSSVVSMIASPFMGLMGAPPSVSDAQEADRQQGVLIQQQGGGAVAIPVVYGLRKLAGVVTFAETGSTNNRFLWVIYTFSEGPVNGLREVFLNDEALPNTIVASLNGGQQVNITQGRFANRVSMLWSPGVYFATPNLSSLGITLKSSTGLFRDAPSFTNTMVHNGLACLFVRYEWLNISTQAESDANPFSGSIPTVQVVMQGRRVASLETATSESHAYGEGGYTERYSTNPAEILLDYLRNPRYGKGLTNTEINWDSFRTAAAKCNTRVQYSLARNISGPILTCNYVLDTNATLFQNTKLLLQGFRAYMPYVQGKYKLRIEDAGNETDILSGEATIVAEMISDPETRSLEANQGINFYDIMGDVTYTGIERSAKYNSVVVTFVDPDAKYSNNQVVFPTTADERQQYIIADGGRENKLEVTFGTLTNAAMAWDMARLLFNKSRFQETATVKVSSHAFELEPGDNIRIQSQILDFGEIPWRVINITYNDDYTVDLSCVRNEDSLYPYARVGEPDRVLPIYVPKGASIYYPVEVDDLSIGLAPPGTVPWSGGGPLHPAPNQPNVGTDPGGVGGAGNITTTSPVAPRPPELQPLTDVIDVINVTYTDVNGLRYGRVVYVQPPNALFAGVDFYFASAGRTTDVFQVIQERQTRGANQLLSVLIGPLANITSLNAQFNQVDVFARVIYNTGEFSQDFVRFQLDPAAAVGTTVSISEIRQSTLQSSSAWPVQPYAPASRKDNTIDGDTAEILISVPQTNPRTMTFRITQNVLVEGANFDVVGFNVYSKAAAATYYTRNTHTFAAGYSPGTVVSTPFTGTVGTTGQASEYDLVIRLVYRDGTESSRQFYTQVSVERSAGFNNPTNILFGRPRVIEATTARSVVTTEQAPPGAVGDPTQLRLGIDFLAATGFDGPGAEITLAPPAESDRPFWSGTRIFYRPVVPGSNPVYDRVDSYNTQIVGGLLPSIRVPLVHGVRYEMIVVALVLVTGQIQESSAALFGSGLVTNNVLDRNYSQQTNGDWKASWAFELTTTTQAMRRIGNPFEGDANPVVNVRAISATSAVNFSYFDPRSDPLRLSEFITLTFDTGTITNYSRVRIYRRDFERNEGTGGSRSPYYGVGRWERVDVTDTGLVTVNLRFPASFRQFNQWYQRTRPSTAEFDEGTGLYRNIAGEPTGLIPIATEPKFVQLLLQVEFTTGAVSADAILITLDNFNAAAIPGTTDMLQGRPIPARITVQSAVNIRDSDFVLGYDRRISEARTSDISYTDRRYRGYWAPVPGRTNSFYPLADGYPPVASGPAIQ